MEKEIGLKAYYKNGNNEEIDIKLYENMAADDPCGTQNLQRSS